MIDAYVVESDGWSRRATADVRTATCATGLNLCASLRAVLMNPGKERDEARRRQAVSASGDMSRLRKRIHEHVEAAGTRTRICRNMAAQRARGDCGAGNSLAWTLSERRAAKGEEE